MIFWLKHFLIWFSRLFYDKRFKLIYYYLPSQSSEKRNNFVCRLSRDPERDKREYFIKIEGVLYKIVYPKYDEEDSRELMLHCMDLGLYHLYDEGAMCPVCDRIENEEHSAVGDFVCSKCDVSFHRSAEICHWYKLYTTYATAHPKHMIMHDVEIEIERSWSY